MLFLQLRLQILEKSQTGTVVYQSPCGNKDSMNLYKSAGEPETVTSFALCDLTLSPAYATYMGFVISVLCYAFSNCFS